MKSKFLMSLAATGLCVCFSSAIWANEVTLLNTSAGSPELEVVYQMAYKNAGEKVIFGGIQTVHLQHEQRISVDMKDYQFAGIVPLSIDGHRLPDEANAFAKPKQCSLATDKNHPSGLIAITLVKQPDGHGSLSCTTQGGIFQ